MRRVSITPRADWQKRVAAKGLIFHDTDEGQPYWDESAYYEFNAREIDVLDQATCALDQLCLQAVQHIIDRNLWERFLIPPSHVDWIRASWDHDEHTVYGRFDLLFDGAGPPKLLEFNADTPTALLEAAVIQWYWLQDIEPDADQFNSIHERLVEIWQIIAATGVEGVTFTSVPNHAEDFITVTYLRDTAHQAGLQTQYLPIDRLGWNAEKGAFVDERERALPLVFKLYPWEWLMREEFGPHLLSARTRWFEPPWKALLSNKAILATLWELFPGHPNLLSAAWEPLPGAQVRKPILGREGANVTILDGAQVRFATDGDYGAGPFVYQEFHPPPRCDGQTPVIGSWLVNGHACGIGIREDTGLITTNTSRFVPHLFR